MEENKSDLKEASSYCRNVNRIFFTEANPFVLKTSKLIKLAELVKQDYSSCKSMGSFARITDITPKNIEKLKTLRKLGYDGIIIGIEIGDDETLAFMNKGYQSKDIIEQCKKLEVAGISYYFFYLTGLSGVGKGKVGAYATAEVINQLHPRIVNANNLTIYKNSELYKEIKNGNWSEESEIEKLVEIKTLIENINIDMDIATYGSSNQVQIFGKLPKNKKMVNRLEEIIEKI
jgi:radical SAM superfamily enzyme YgiQ (UPF0313 family)